MVILYYISIILACSFFLISLALFFYLRIPDLIKEYLSNEKILKESRSKNTKKEFNKEKVKVSLTNESRESQFAQALIHASETTFLNTSDTGDVEEPIKENIESVKPSLKPKKMIDIGENVYTEVIREEKVREEYVECTEEVFTELMEEEPKVEVDRFNEATFTEALDEENSKEESFTEFMETESLNEDVVYTELMDSSFTEFMESDESTEYLDR